MEYQYCHWCGGELSKNKDNFFCKNCQREIFMHSQVAAGIYIIKDDKVLLIRRGRNPQKGKLDTIGGFLKYGEHPTEGITRETKEETGLDVRIIHFLGVYKNNYLFQGINWKVLDFFFVGEIVSGKPEAKDDAASLEWVPIGKTPKDLAFVSTKKSFKDLQRLYQK